MKASIIKRLKFIVCGNVDDGKSTLIGRLLVDTDSLFIDQLEDLKKTSQLRQNSEDPSLMNFALVTDGLKSEREQGITIDVAYRFFSTEKRAFCIIDVPGHAQYSRNMFTGATNADIALLLIDSKNGISEQTRRHLMILSLVGMKEVMVVINKMDMVGYDQKHFNQLKTEVEILAHSFNLKNVKFIPLSSLRGDNLIKLSGNMSWYLGETLLEHLENFNSQDNSNNLGIVAAIQGVIRVGDERYYMLDQVAGVFKSGDEVLVYPQEILTKLKAVTAYHTQVESDLDIERGSFLVQASSQTAQELVRANVCWFSTFPLKKTPYLFSFCGNATRCQVITVIGEYDLQSGNLQDKNCELTLNDLVQLEIKLSKPLFCTNYHSSQKLGAFLLIDPLTNQTVAAGMIL